MSEVVWAFHAEVCELLDESKRISSRLVELEGEQSLDIVPELLGRIDVLEQQPEFHRYFAQAAVRITGETPSYVSVHALVVADLQQFLRSIEGNGDASEALKVANFAGVVNQPENELADYKKALRGEAAVAAEICGSEQQATQQSPASPRLVLKLKPAPHVILDGKTPVPLEQDEASCLKVLLDARDWRSSRIVGEQTSIVRADRPLKALREKLDEYDVIEVDQNCGSRVKPAWLEQLLQN